MAPRPLSDTGSAEPRMRMTGRRDSNVFARRRLLAKHLVDQIGAVLEARANHALGAFVPIIHTITAAAPAHGGGIPQQREL